MTKYKGVIKIISSRLFYFVLGVLFFFTILVARAAWNSTVASGQMMTAALWNDLINKVISLDSSVTSLNSSVSNLNAGNLNYQQNGCVRITYSPSGDVMCPAGKYAAGVWDDGGGMAGMNGVVCCN